MATFTYETADDAHWAFASRVNKFQADDELMLNGVTTAKVDDLPSDLPSFADWDILIVTQKPRDALIVRGSALFSADSIMPTSKEEKAAIRFARYKLTELDKADHKQMILRAVAEQIGQRAAIVDGRLQIDGQLIWDLSIKDQQTHGYGYTKDTNSKMVVIVGDYGNKSRYPQRKDGTYNYLDIATKLVQYHDARVVSMLSEKKRDSNQLHVKTLRDQFDYNSRWRFEATTEESKPVRTERTLVFFGTPDEVLQYISAVDELVAKFKR